MKEENENGANIQNPGIFQEIADYVLGYIDEEEDSTVQLAYKECSVPPAHREYGNMEQI